MPVLITTAPVALRAVLPEGWSAASAWAALQELLAGRLSPAHAALFAEPIADGGGGIAWRSAGESVRRFYDLDAGSRAALLHEVGRLTSEMRRLGAALRAGTPEKDASLAALLAAAIEIPGFDHVYAVDGRPVLAGWGHVGAGVPGPLGLLASYDDGRAFTPPARRPWQVWAVTGGALLLLLAVVPFLAASLPTGWLGAPDTVCRIDEARLAPLHALDEERTRGQLLQEQLASLRTELGTKQARCPLPEPPRRVAEAPPQPAPTPPRREPPPPPAPPPPPSPPPPPQLNEDQSRVQQRGGRTGRLQVILAWDDTNDLDLKVTCPTGETVWADNRAACGGGRLDVDANCCQGQLFVDRPVRNPVENVVWQNPPVGRYRVVVDFYSRRAPPASPYRVTVLVDGQPKWHTTGTLRQGERNRAVLDFTLPPP